MLLLRGPSLSNWKSFLLMVITTLLLRLPSQGNLFVDSFLLTRPSSSSSYYVPLPSKDVPRSSIVLLEPRLKGACQGQANGVDIETSPGASSSSTPTTNIARRPKNRTWEENLQKLKEYKEIHGHCNVPCRYKEDTKLGCFVKYNRDKAREGTITEEQRTKLDAMGFVWDVREYRFQQMLKRLKEYQETHGDCNVPSGYKDRQLAGFVETCRFRNRNGTLNEKRKQIIDSIGLVEEGNEGGAAKFAGFVWYPEPYLRQQYAHRMVEKLKAYKALHGDCNVPTDWKEDTKLARYVRYRRDLAREGIIDEEERAALDELGMVWDGVEAMHQRRRNRKRLEK